MSSRRMLTDYCKLLRSFCNHPSQFKKSLSPVILHAIPRILPRIWLKKLNVQGTVLIHTVHGNKPHQTIDTQLVQLKLTPVLSGSSCPSFKAKPYVRKDLNVGTEVIDFDSLQVQYRQI